MNRKGQSALEFLTTYAWAFIVIIIVIAAIAYFGVLRPNKILPDRCNFNVGFGCEAYTASSSGNTFNVSLKNGLGSTITVTAVTASVEGNTPLAVACTTPNSPALPVTWTTGANTAFGFTACDFASIGFVKGEKGKILLSLNYYDPKSGAGFAKTADGEIFTTMN